MLQPNENPEASALEVVILDPLRIESNPTEVLRYMGYPADGAPNDFVLERVSRAIEKASDVQRPRGMYALYSVTERDRGSLTLGCGVTFLGKIGEFLANAQRAAVFLATAGSEVVELGESTSKQGDTLGGLVFHALGACLAEAVVERIVDDLRRRLKPGDALTLRYSPGYCGVPLAQQREIFRLVDSSKVGVELLPSFIMRPVKSVSGLIGIGPEDAVTAYGNPCDRCPLTDCAMRR